MLSMTSFKDHGKEKAGKTDRRNRQTKQLNKWVICAKQADNIANWGENFAKYAMFLIGREWGFLCVCQICKQ